jgi:DNA-3-methyladenine glycosylase II
MHGVGGDATPIAVWKDAPAHLGSVDPRLAKIIDGMGGKSPKIAVIGDPFEALVRAILHQSIRAEQSSLRVDKLKGLFGGAFPRPPQVLAFPADRLREIGLSDAQARAVYLLAKDVAEQRVDLAGLTALGDEDVKAELRKLKGVGEWSAQMFLVFHLQRPDVWMTGDVSLRNAVGKLFELERPPTPAEMEALSAGWRPWRSAAAWYIWKAVSGFTPGLE